MTENILFDVDSYKQTQWNMLPADTEYVYSYFEARKGAEHEYTVFFGLQILLEKLTKQITIDDVYKAYGLATAHFGNENYFNYEGWKYIVEHHNGFLPVHIKAVQEGAVVPINNVLMTIVNTDPKCAWLTNYLETFLSRVWYPTTVATTSRFIKERLREYLILTGCKDIDQTLSFMLHDFGSRGASSQETAAIGGAAHLVNFKGTDTVIALRLVLENYNNFCTGYSIAASEHSIMTAEGPEGEEKVIERLLNQYPTGLLSLVSDSYSYEKCVTQLYCKKFKQKILERDGTLVIRPDSVTKVYDKPETLMLFTLRELWSAFDGTHNEAGFKLLNPKVKVIWGDGLSPNKIIEIVEYCYQNGFATENMVFGMGGGLLQKCNRDTERFAFKCSAQFRNGKWHDVYKKPEDESKASKRGLLGLVKGVINEGYSTIGLTDLGIDYTCELETVFKNGHIMKVYEFDDVRNKVEEDIKFFQKGIK